MKRRIRRGSKTRRRRGGLRFVRSVTVSGLAVATIVGGFLGARSALPAVQQAIRAPRFHLRAIDWVGTRALHPGDLAVLLDLPRSLPLIDVDVDVLAERVRGHPRIERCEGLRIPPDRVMLRVVERVPVGRISGASEGFDESGSRFPLLPDEAERLTPVRGEPSAAIPLLRASSGFGLELASVEVRSATDVRFQVKGSDVVVQIGSEVERALREWDTLRMAGVVRRYRPERVDLRSRGNAVLRGLQLEERGG